VGLGQLIPPSSDRLPLDYAVSVSPLPLRLVYGRWGGDFDGRSLGTAG